MKAPARLSSIPKLVITIVNTQQLQGVFEYYKHSQNT